MKYLSLLISLTLILSGCAGPGLSIQQMKNRDKLLYARVSDASQDPYNRETLEIAHIDGKWASAQTYYLTPGFHVAELAPTEFTDRWQKFFDALKSNDFKCAIPTREQILIWKARNPNSNLLLEEAYIKNIPILEDWKNHIPRNTPLVGKTVYLTSTRELIIQPKLTNPFKHRYKWILKKKRFYASAGSVYYGQLIKDYLPEDGSDLNATDAEGRTLAHKDYNPYLIELMIASGFNVNSADSNRRTVLHEIATSGHYKLVSLYENRDRADTSFMKCVTPQVPDGEQLLKRSIKLLIKAGADVNAVDANGRTPLDEAETNGYKWIAEMLLQAGGTRNNL